MRTLVVSNFPVIARLLISMLAELGHRDVEEASDSESALAKIDTGSIDLVVCEWTLEPQSGIDLLARVRANEAHARLAFVLMFADSSPEKIGHLRSRGASGHLVKPFDVSALRSAITAALAPAQS
jgi:two-component system chemotaxis response regulator CheY